MPNREGKPKLEEEFVNNDGKRRQLLDAIIDLIPSAGPQPQSDLWSQPLPLAKDVPHALQRLAAETDTSRRTFLVGLIFTAWSRAQEYGVFDLIAAAWQSSVDGTGPKLLELEETFSWALRPIRIQSKEARTLRSQFKKRRKEEELYNKRLQKQELKQHKGLPTPPLDEQIEAHLEKLECGDLDAWITLNYLLLFELDGTSHLNEYQSNLQEFPGWQRAPSPIHERLLAGGRSYLREYDPQTLDRIQNYDFHRPTSAGYRALRLLIERNSAEVETLPPELWARWAASLVLFPDFGEDERALSRRSLLTTAYRHVPKIIVEAFRLRIERDKTKNNPTASLWMLESALDKSNEALSKHPILETARPLVESFWQPGDEISQFLIEQMKCLDWEPAIFGVWLDLLLKRGVPEAETYAHRLVTLQLPAVEVASEGSMDATKMVVAPATEDVEKDDAKQAERDRAKVAAATLMSEAEDNGWSVVWPVFQRDPSFGRAVVEWLAPQSHTPSDRGLAGLSERELADFYLWLEHEYPHSQDPKVSGIHRATTREVAGQYRDGILNQLALHKTPAACREIERLMQELPEVTPLLDTLHHARDLMGREQWQPMEPDKVLSLGEEMANPAIAIVTVLPEEHEAMKALLDDPELLVIEGDGAGRVFTTGSIPALNGRHRVMLARLAGMNNNLSAAGITQLLERFPSVNSVILCGIAGGVAYHTKPSDHVRLGDIVMCDLRGVIQYDYGRETLQGEQIVREVRSSPKPPGAALMAAADQLMDGETAGQRPWLEHIKRATTVLVSSDSLLNWERPDEATDILLNSRVTSRKQSVQHPADERRRKSEPRVFCGPVASSNFVLCNPQRRDELRDAFKVRAIEMEASGVADATWLSGNAHFTVVRGICDYCDARNKGDEWHAYAAIVAAALTRALLEALPVTSKE